MAQMTSGKVLREARERKGYDLNTVARRLRIRPDILRAIEAGDFSSMPPRGYTRNMVNAYARLLGLNPSEIVNMYLDEAYAEQVQRARGSSNSGFSFERNPRRTRQRTGAVSSANHSYESNRTSTIRSDVTQATRVLYDDGTKFARDDYGVTRERMARPGKSDRDFLSHHSGYDTEEFNFLDDADSSRRSTRNVYAKPTPNSWSASRLPAFLQNRIVLIVAAVVLVALIAGVAFALNGAKNAQHEEEVAQLPVSGVADTTGDASGSSSAAVVDIAPTSSRVIYSVESGKECYVETYLDGKMTPEMLNGPVERNVEVTTVWVITTYSPETLKVVVDGQEVTLKVDEHYNNMYAYTVDFPAILKKWNSDHGVSKSSTGAAATGSNASSQNGQGDSTQKKSYEESVNYDDSVNLEENQANDAESESEEEEEYEEEEYEEEPAYTEETEWYEEEYTDEGESYDEENQEY